MCRKQGFTFVEMLITIVILGIALSTLTSALSTSVIQGSAPIVEGKALSLAQAYLDEILPLKFDDQSQQGGGSVALGASPCVMDDEGQDRADFDDVDDYHGITNSPPFLLQTSFDMSQYAAYSVSVSVACAGLEAGLSADHLVKRISVQVQTPENKTRILSVYKGNF